MVNSNSPSLDRVFAALSDPTRRAIVSRLAHGPYTVSQLAEPFAISLPATSKHLKILDEAGLISRVRYGRTCRCTLQPASIEAAATWIAEQRAFWNRNLDSLESFLAQDTKEEE